MVAEPMLELSALGLLKDACLIVTPEGAVRYANSAACELYGIAPDVKATLRELVRVEKCVHDGSDLGFVRESPFRAECVHVPANAEPRRVEWTVHEIELSDGKHVLSLARPLRSVSESPTQEQLELSERQQQSQRMEAIGLLAGGVAHDFNNLLTGILGFVELSLLELPDEEQQLAANLQEIRSAAQQAADLTRRLLIFSRTQLIEPKVLDLCDLVTQAERFLARVIGEDIQLTVSRPPDAAFIRIDPSQLNHVLVNLATNAREAMPSGGELTIEVCRLQASAEFCALHPGMVPGPYVQLAVTDTGVGLTKTQSSRVFEPFYSTKQRQRGTGLGLSTVYGIARQNDGVATLFSEPGIGTTLKLYFPEVQEQPQLSSQNALPSLLSTGEKATILLVEDEPIVRRVAKQILQRAGYAVLEAADGTTAELLHEQLAPVTLLLSDVVMPDVNGRELFERLSKRQPGLRCVLMSGYTDDEILRRGIRTSELNFVSKPFTSQSLLDKISRVVHGKRR